MTLTRRQTLIGAAATVAAAALPAVAESECTIYPRQLWLCHYELPAEPFGLRYIDRLGYEWAGGAEFLAMVRRLDDAGLTLSDGDLVEIVELA
jgi:hypothetical protein